MSILRRHPFIFIFFLALLLHLAYLAEMHGTSISRLHTWQQSDMNTYLTVAGQILQGDLLVHTPFHPYHATHAVVGTQDQWQRWLGGEHVFYQVPGYYYFLAILLKLFGGSLSVVKIVQAFLGAGHAALLGLVGEKMINRRAGIIAGLLAAIYGPLIAVDSMILREAPALILATAAIYQILRALEATGASTSWRVAWGGAGMVLGVAAIMRESGLILFGSIWLWAMAHSLRRKNSLPRIAPWLLLGGFLLSLTPVVVRNVAVGAPPFSLSPLFACNFATANTSDNISGGATYHISGSLSKIMTASDGRLLEVIRLTLLTYEGMPAQLMVNWWAKFSTIWSNVEIPDNYSYEYLVNHSRLLSVLPRFVCILFPALAALGILLWQRFVPPPSQPGSISCGALSFAPRTLSLILCCLAVNIVLLSLNTVVGRYRLTIVPFLMLLAAGTMVQAIVWWRSGEVRKLGGLSAFLAVVFLTWWFWPAHPIVQQNAIRATDYIVAAKDLVHQGDRESARRELEEGLRYCSIPTGFDWLSKDCKQRLILTTEMLGVTVGTE